MAKKGTQEWRKHVSEGRKGLGGGETNPAKRPEVKQKYREWLKTANRKGENHPNWKGGKKLSEERGRKKQVEKNKREQERLAGRPRPEQCEICGAFGKEIVKKAICFDHDHITGKFRGWVCGRCNLIMGLAKDNTETLTAIINYLKRSKTLD